VANAVAGTAVVNLAVNGGIAWLSVQGHPTVPLWPTGFPATPSIFADTVGTLFVLPLITCLLCTTAVWRELSRGRLTPLSPAGLWCVLTRLPARRLRRGLLLGAVSTLLIAPPVTLMLAALHAGNLSDGAFVVYKMLFAVALGALVTPVIAWRAMADEVGPA